MSWVRHKYEIVLKNGTVDEILGTEAPIHSDGVLSIFDRVYDGSRRCIYRKTPEEWSSTRVLEVDVTRELRHTPPSAGADTPTGPRALRPSDEVAAVDAGIQKGLALGADNERLREGLRRIEQGVMDPATMARNLLAGKPTDTPTYCAHGMYLGNCGHADCDYAPPVIPKDADLGVTLP